MTRPLVKVLVLSKNEYDLIEPFLRFYGYLFGYENIVVIDNGSTHKDVLRVYEEYRAKGVEIKVDARPLTTNDDLMTEHIRSLRGSCEWLCLLETDEFMFWTQTKDDTEAVVPKDTITQFLKDVPSDISILRFGSFLNSCVDPQDDGYKDYRYSCPPRQIVRFTDANWDKIIVRLDDFDRVTQWPHHARAIKGERVAVNSLGLLHYHETGMLRKFERSHQIVETTYGITHLPPHMQIPIANHLISVQGHSYHRVTYHRKALLRTFIIETCRAMKGRSPTLTELLHIEEQGTTIDALVQYIATTQMPRQIPESDALSDAALVFYEMRMPHEMEIHQVKNTFQTILDT